MKAKTGHEDSRSLKTFFLYTSIVCFFIIISLSIKAFFIIKQSKFHSDRQFIVAIAKDTNLKEIIVFNSQESSVSVLKIADKNMTMSSFGKSLGVISDATISLPKDFSMLSDPAENITQIALHYPSIKTNLTLFDFARLVLLAKRISPQNKTIEELSSPVDSKISNRLLASLVSDNKIISENISIQVVNATDVPGIGKRLERVITNMGGNVVSITTAHKSEPNSKIRYFGKETYTLKRLQALLQFPLEQMQKESIADVMITIGESSKNADKF